MGKLEFKPITEEDAWPICPHCEREIKDVIPYFEQAGVIAMKVTRIFVCPHCRKVIAAGTVGF